MITEPVIESLQRWLDVSAERQRLISSNLANIDTPGFKASDIDFEQALAEAGSTGPDLSMAQTDPRHLSTASQARPGIFEETGIARRDGNNVNLDHEMAKLSKSSLLFQAGTAMTQSKLRSLRNVITGGR